MKRILLTGLLSGLFVLPGQAQMLTGQVAQVNFQPDIQQDLYQENVRKTQENSDIPLAGEIRNLNGNLYAATGSGSWIPLGPETPITQVRIQNRIQPRSAIGVCHRSSGVIYYIDPNSDLYGLVQLGDRLLSINGIEPYTAERMRVNFGPAGTVVQCLFSTNEGLKRISCRRHDIRDFGPEWQRIQRY